MVKLEIGKWYNCTTLEGKYNLYFQPGQITEINIYFKDRFYISNGKQFKVDYLEIASMSNIRLLTDLTEIQFFLPEGHLDKNKIYECW